MAILMFIGVYLLNFSTTELMIGDYYRDATEAYYLAEAGLQKALSLLKEDLNYRLGSKWYQFLSRSHPLGQGTYKVSLQDQGSNKVMITSTGYVDKANQQITALVFAAKGNPVFFHALSVRANDLFVDGTVDGDIYVGGDVTIGGYSEVRGDVKAVGTVSGKDKIYGTIEEYSEPMSFPAVDEELYLTRAVNDGSYYEGNLEQEELLLKGIVFVEGDVIVEYISGDGLLFARGDVTIHRGKISRTSRGMPIIITPGTLTVNNPVGSINIEAVVFADSFLCSAGAKIKGCIVAGMANMGENVNLNYDENVLISTVYSLPGDEAEEVYLKVISWSHPDD